MQVCVAEEVTPNVVDVNAKSENVAQESDAPEGVAEEDDTDNVFADYAQNTPIQGFVEYNQDEADGESSAVYLDSTKAPSLNLQKPNIVNAKSVKAEMKKPTFDPFDKNLIWASKFSTHEYSINPISASYSKKFGSVSFGTIYDSSLDSAQMSYTTSVFAKYENKYFALSSGFSKNTNDSSDMFKDKFYVAPELKITKRLSFLDVMQTDVSQINKKNELVLRYTPSFGHHRDDVQLELGAGQSFYDDQYVKSSVRFSTKIKL